MEGIGIDGAAVAATVLAMERGDPTIAQGALQAGGWNGRADILRPTPVRRFVVDYSPDRQQCRPLCALPSAVVTASAGKVQDVVVSDNPLTRGYRVSFTLDPQKSDLCELRIELKFDDSRCAEVWLFRWTKR